MEQARVLLFAALMIYTPCSMLNITRDGCGNTELCLASPDNCDPAGSDDCMFVSFEYSPPDLQTSPQSPSSMTFRMKGDTLQFLAVGLTAESSQNETEFFICSRTNVDFGGVNTTEEYFYAIRNNTDNSTKPDSSVKFNNTQRNVTGNTLKCQFSYAKLNSSSTRGNNDLDFSVILGKGENANFSSLNISITTGLLNLSNPRANIPTTTAPTSMVSTSLTMVPTAAARGPNQTHALLILSALMLSVMLRG